MPLHIRKTYIQDTRNTAKQITPKGSQLLQVAQLQHHSATAVLTNDNGLLVAWFAGSQEGASDVAIYASRISANGVVESPRVIITRQSLGKQLKRYYAKLGNPVLYRLTNGDIGLYVVAVSIGGWSISAVALLTSSDEGITWETQRELHTSPFFNISTLVKYTPFVATDSSDKHYHLLPAYHELFSKHAQLIILDEGWRTKMIKRLQHQSIQPSGILAADTLVFAMRNTEAPTANRMMKQIRINSALRVTPQNARQTVKNPNAAVAVNAISDDIWLLAYNNSAYKRHDLSLAYSLDQGHNWYHLQQLEYDEKREFSYPYFVFDGHFIHLFYTFDRKAIKYSWWSLPQLHNMLTPVLQKAHRKISDKHLGTNNSADRHFVDSLHF